MKKKMNDSKLSFVLIGPEVICASAAIRSELESATKLAPVNSTNDLNVVFISLISADEGKLFF